jgi:HTH-type transcriptional regulator/antitoxin HigA
MTHPGELIAEYLEARRMSQIEFACRIDATPKYVCELLAQRARVTVKMALRFEPVLGRPAHFWINLQARYDLAKARK